MLSKTSPAQFHTGSITPEYRVDSSESIANPYTKLVHVFSDPLLLTRTCPPGKMQANSGSLHLVFGGIAAHYGTLPPTSMLSTALDSVAERAEKILGTD